MLGTQRPDSWHQHASAKQLSFSWPSSSSRPCRSAAADRWGDPSQQARRIDEWNATNRAPIAAIFAATIEPDGKTRGRAVGRSRCPTTTVTTRQRRRPSSRAARSDTLPQRFALDYDGPQLGHAAVIVMGAASPDPRRRPPSASEPRTARTLLSMTALSCPIRSRADDAVRRARALLPRPASAWAVESPAGSPEP